MKKEIDWAKLEQTKILIVDDSEPMRELVFCLLQELGCKCIEKADGGPSGLEQLQTNEFKMAFLDIDMPEMNGIEVLKTVKKENPKTYIIMLSGHSSTQNVKEAITNGANGFIVKPCSIQKIKESMENFARFSGLTL